MLLQDSIEAYLADDERFIQSKENQWDRRVDQFARVYGLVKGDNPTHALCDIGTIAKLYMSNNSLKKYERLIRARWWDLAASVLTDAPRKHNSVIFRPTDSETDEKMQTVSYALLISALLLI